jgi:hypothetical protein
LNIAEAATFSSETTKAKAPCLAAILRIALTASASASYFTGRRRNDPDFYMWALRRVFQELYVCPRYRRSIRASGIHVSVPPHETSSMNAEITAAFFSIEVRI